MTYIPEINIFPVETQEEVVHQINNFPGLKFIIEIAFITVDLPSYCFMEK